MKHALRDLDLPFARDLNLLLGSWLLVSALVWRHSEPQFLVTTLVGAVVALVAPFEIGLPLARRIVMGAGAALVLAAFTLPHTSTLTMGHNALVGLAVAGLSFFGPPHGIVPITRPAPPDAYDGLGL
jgi:hypothetical protein